MLLKVEDLGLLNGIGRTVMKGLGVQLGESLLFDGGSVLPIRAIYWEAVLLNRGARGVKTRFCTVQSRRAT